MRICCQTWRKPSGKTTGCSAESQSYRKVREHYKSSRKNKQYKNTVEQHLEDDGYRQTLQSQGVTEEKVKEWDHLAEGPQREHDATAAERDQGSKTFFLKLTAAGGARTVATAKHPDLHRAKEWHREHVRRQGGNSPTQQQTQLAVARLEQVTK